MLTDCSITFSNHTAFCNFDTSVFIAILTSLQLVDDSQINVNFMFIYIFIYLAKYFLIVVAAFFRFYTKIFNKL